MEASTSAHVASELQRRVRGCAFDPCTGRLRIVLDLGGAFGPDLASASELMERSPDGGWEMADASESNRSERIFRKLWKLFRNDPALKGLDAHGMDNAISIGVGSAVRSRLRKARPEGLVLIFFKERT